ncbi:unnamed protein product, partial [Protopolystoma xenopodis]
MGFDKSRSQYSISTQESDTMKQMLQMIGFNNVAQGDVEFAVEFLKNAGSDVQQIKKEIERQPPNRVAPTVSTIRRTAPPPPQPLPITHGTVPGPQRPPNPYVLPGRQHPMAPVHPPPPPPPPPPQSVPPLRASRPHPPAPVAVPVPPVPPARVTPTKVFPSLPSVPDSASGLKVETSAMAPP